MLSLIEKKKSCQPGCEFQRNVEEKMYIRTTCFSEADFSTLREMGLERKHPQRTLYVKSDTKKTSL